MSEKSINWDDPSITDQLGNLKDILESNRWKNDIDVAKTILKYGYRQASPSQPAPEKNIKCTDEWHNLNYYEYVQKHGVYPRSCPKCLSCFND